MELRKVEQELEKLSSEWKALRRKRPRFKGDAGPATTAVAHDMVGGGSSDGLVVEALSTQMPSWKELTSKVKDDEIFPPEEEEEEDSIIMENDGANANNSKSGTNTSTNNNESNNGADNTVGYSEFGMCLAPSDNAGEGSESNKKNEGATTTSAGNGGSSVWERYAAKSSTIAPKSKNTQPEKVKKEASLQSTVVDEDEEEQIKVEDVSAKDILAGLKSLHERFIALDPKIEKFLMKLNDRDPVTKKARYGEKTMFRVKNVVRIYKALEQGVAIIFHDTDAGGPSLVSSLQSQIQQHDEQLNAHVQAHQTQQQLESERLAKEKLAAEEHANQQRLLEEQTKKNEERELARRAEEARLRRVEEEQRVLDAERRADQELLALVPTLGAEGVREQIGRMREGLKDDRAALDVALGSLYTLFEQIVRKPEEINFRRVRRDHPKFMEDIGRHVGGREVLIAAGFKLEKLDGVPSFFSKEPHIESDMDGWSDWFDSLKKTLEVVEEEMLK
ncbi:hypothetical protein ACHAXR_004129 [Thalassiosira sp. AJA248-18]